MLTINYNWNLSVIDIFRFYFDFNVYIILNNLIIYHANFLFKYVYLAIYLMIYVLQNVFSTTFWINILSKLSNIFNFI